GTGLNVNGAGVVALIGSSTVTGNGAGVSSPLGTLCSFKNNQIAGNTVDGTPIAPCPGVFTAATHDFNGDGKSDILWYNTSNGQALEWLVNGTSVIGGGSPGSAASPWAIVGQRDFNGDGFADILWRNGTTGQLVVWLLNGASMIGGGSPGS